MSFQRRSVSLSSNQNTARGIPRGQITPNSSRVIPNANLRSNPVTPVKSQTSSSPLATLWAHPAVRPSIHLPDVPAVSTGSRDLDDLMGHAGIPLGSMILLEESGNTDFASVLMRSFAAQSVIQSRASSNSPVKGDDYKTKVILVGTDEAWGTQLPGLYKDKKQAKKDKIQQEENKISVGNLVNKSISKTEDKSEADKTNSNMKIAWRYQNVNSSSDGSSKSTTETNETKKPHYLSTFDLTSRLVPGATLGKEIEYVGSGIYFMSKNYKSGESYLMNLYNEIKSKIEKTLKETAEPSTSNPITPNRATGPNIRPGSSAPPSNITSNKKNNTIIRIIIPSLFHPLTYPPETTAPHQALRFVHALLHLARSQYPHNVSIMCSLSLDLYPRESYMTTWFETIFDGVVHLDPFPDGLLSQLAQETDTKSQTDSTSGSSSSNTDSSNDKNKTYQGLVHLYKVPLMSERGAMLIRKSEYAFRVGRRQFEIEKWGIPVEDEDEPEAQQTQPTSPQKTVNNEKNEEPAAKNVKKFGIPKTTTKNANPLDY